MLFRRPVAFVLSAGVALALAGCAVPPQLPPSEPNPPTRTAAVGVFAQGDPAKVAAFESWLGRPVDVKKLHFNKTAGWSGWTNPGWLKKFAGQQIAINAMPFPDGVGGTLAAAGSGAYDAHYAAVARNLIAYGYEDADLIIGHEFNGSWYAWSAAYGKHGDFVNMYRRMVTVFRAQPGAAFRFNWVLAKGQHQMPDPTMAYPGDGYVDVVGMDIYDNDSLIRRGSSPDWAQQRWEKFLSMPFGLNWLAEFGAAHGKPLSIGEWGLSTANYEAGVGGGDNVYYVEQMHRFVTTHNVAYHSYHNVRASDGDHDLLGGAFPNAAAKYRQLFGG